MGVHNNYSILHLHPENYQKFSPVGVLSHFILKTLSCIMSPTMLVCGYWAKVILQVTGWIIIIHPVLPPQALNLYLMNFTAI